MYPPATAIDNFRLVLARGNVGDYYIDNLSISHLCLDLPEPDAPGEDGGDTPSSKLIDSIMLNMSQSLGADVYIDNFYVAHIRGDRSAEDGR